MKITILVIGSSGDCYPVEFSDESGALCVLCHCQAGSLQQMCGHKIALLKGDERTLRDSSQKILLDQVLSSPGCKKLKSRLDEYEKSLLCLEHEKEELVKREKRIKREFAYEVTHGHSIGDN